MDISKINIFNTNKQRVSPFKGDALVSENNKTTNENGQTFLYGACTVSAGILAIALANRAGLFSKAARKITKAAQTQTIDIEPLKNKPVIKAQNVIEEFSQKTETLGKNTIDPLLLQTNIKYPKSLTELNPDARRMFLNETMHKISNMSYENQYDEFKIFLGVIKKENPKTLEWEFGGIPNNLKRDNHQRFANEINSVSKEVPELNDTVFYQYRFNEAAKNLDFSICKKFDEEREKSRFFTTVKNNISGMSYEEQPTALKSMFDALKEQDLKTFNWSFVPDRNQLHGDNYDKALTLINETSKEVPELNKTVFYNYRIAEAFDKNDFVSCKEYIRENDKFKFFSNFTQKMHDMSYEDQPNAMRTLLEALKQEDLKAFNWTYTPARWNFKGDNFDKVANIIDEFSKEKPELNKTVFKKYRVEEALDKWNFSFCDSLETVEEKRGFFADYLNRIYGMSYNDQQKGIDTLFEALKKQDLKTFDWNCLPRNEKFKEDNYNRFVNKINEVTSQIPELNNTVFYKFRTQEALNKEDFSFYKKLKSETDKSAFLNTYIHKIYGMSEEDQQKAFDAVLKAVKEENPKTFAWNFSILPQYLKGENHNKFIEAIDKLTEERPELNKTVFYRYRVAKAQDENNYSIYNILKTNGEKAAFFTNISNKLTKLDKEDLDEEFTKYLDFIKTIPAKDLPNSILFNIGEFKGNNNIYVAQKVIKFAQENPEYQDIMLRHLVKYTPDSEFMKELTHQPIRTQDPRILSVEENRRAWSEPGRRTEDNKDAYDKHIENAINIRNLLTKLELKCQNIARTINRADWFNPKNYNFNNLDVIFADYAKINNIRKAAFKYDMMNGVSRQEADKMIKHLTKRHKTSQGLRCENVYGMNLEEMTDLINKSVVNINTQA